MKASHDYRRDEEHGGAGYRALRAANRARSVALAALLLLVPTGGCVASPAGDEPVPVRAAPVSLDPARTEVDRVGALRYRAGFALSSNTDGFGGFSGLWIADDGSRLLAVSDKGPLWQAELEHAPDGRLTALTGWRVIEPGRLPADPRGSDAEALAGYGPDALVIAYEGDHRLRRLPLADLRATPEAMPSPLTTHTNEGIEGLTVLPDGALLALSEGVPDGAGGIRAWRIGDGQIVPLSYAPSAGMVPTGADVQGERVYVVERRFSWLGGFTSRIVALPLAAASSGRRLEPVELARLQPPLITENFEGLAARAGPDGETLLYLLSDDNFLPLQRTLLLQFELDESLLGRAGEGVGAHQHAERQQQQ